MLAIHSPDFPACEFMNWWKQQYISLLFEGAECPYKLLSVNKEPNYQCLNVLPVRIPSDRVLLFLFIFGAAKIQLMNWTHKFVYIPMQTLILYRESDWCFWVNWKTELLLCILYSPMHCFSWIYKLLFILMRFWCSKFIFDYGIICFSVAVIKMQLYIPVDDCLLS